MILEVWPSVIKANPNAWLILVGARQRPTISFETERLEIEAYQKAIFKLIAEVPQILYVGEQTNIERWYQIANLFVFPSLQEGFPNALLEAMSTGLPCLTNRFLGFPAGELGETQGIIQVVNASKEAWSKAILDLLEKKDLRVLKGISARKLVQEKHELSCTLDKYAKLYELLALSSKIPSE